MEVAPLSVWLKTNSSPIIIAGPCSAESENQIISTAQQLKENIKISLFRAGVWKPRTRPGSFEGLGEVALPWLRRVRNELGIPVCTEVANPYHVELALKHEIDALWVGARTTTSPFAVQEIVSAVAGTDIPILIKNPISSDLNLWIGALERFSKAKIKKLVAVHRGFSTSIDSRYRNSPVWKNPIELKLLFPNLPIICDPSHIAGDRSLIGEVCQRALDLNFDGLMIESHFEPNSALSDKKQQVDPKTLKLILSNLLLKTEHSPNKNFEMELESLREKIDQIDYELLGNLKMRMEIVKQIGRAKRNNQVTPLQKSRIEYLLRQRTAKAKELGLSEEYIREIFSYIHSESLKSQTEIMDNN
jgi:chorismate mutase